MSYKRVSSQVIAISWFSCMQLSVGWSIDTNMSMVTGVSIVYGRFWVKICFDCYEKLEPKSGISFTLSLLDQISNEFSLTASYDRNLVRDRLSVNVHRSRLMSHALLVYWSIQAFWSADTPKLTADTWLKPAPTTSIIDMLKAIRCYCYNV